MTQNDYINLVNEAKGHEYRYYVLAQPTISDAEFDALVGRIEQTEQEHPEWTLADSPTQQVGSDVSNNGRRLVRHRTRMLSCQKAQTQEAVTKWIATTEKKLKRQVVYALEWKLDGISCSLVYQDGVLVSAATRGDKGVMGQDLMEHVALMPSVPQRIGMDGRVEVRGEIVCPKQNLASLGYKDCRTAAAALCNQVWPSQDCAKLVFAAWQMDADGQRLEKELDGMDAVCELGFSVSTYTDCWGDEITERLADFEAEREQYEMPTDGVVIKIDDKALAASLGATEHHPKGSIAYKFSAQKTVTRVIGIEVKVGATGRRTPVAYLEPVTILGREVSSASLGSEGKMAELGICEGCMVEVGLSNDVTPKIYRVISGGTPVINDCEITETESSSFVAVAEDEVPLQAEIEQIETNQTNTSEDLENLNQFDEFLGEADPKAPAEQNDAPQPIQLDLFAQMQEELAALRAENAALMAKNENLTKQCNMTQTEVCTPHYEFDTENCSCATQGQPSTPRGERRQHQEHNRQSFVRQEAERKRRQQEQADRAYERLYGASAVTAEQDSGNGIRSWLKPLGIAAASVAVLVIIFNTGLLIPLGILGLATGGILK